MANCNPSTRQYIGARYVPRHMGEWSADTQYSALDVVLYTDGNTYTAKCYPPKGTVPTDNKYWSLSAQFNQQLASVQNTIAEMTSDISMLKSKTEYVTPEQFGAKGDGTNDDYLFLQRAIDTGKPVLCFGDYAFSSPLKIGNESVFYCPGVLRYTGQDTAIIFYGGSNAIYINHLISNGKGIVLQALYLSYFGVSNSVFNINFIDSVGDCITLDAYNDVYSCIYYVEINGVFLRPNYGKEPNNYDADCVVIKCKQNNNDAFINAVTFNGYRCTKFKRGIYTINNENSQYMYGITFNDFSIERDPGTNSVLIDINNPTSIYFNNLNVIEGGNIVINNPTREVVLNVSGGVTFSQIMDTCNVVNSGRIIVNGDIMDVNSGIRYASRIEFNKNGAINDSEEPTYLSSTGLNKPKHGFSKFLVIRDTPTDKPIVLPKIYGCDEYYRYGIPTLFIKSAYSGSGATINDSEGRNVLTLGESVTGKLFICSFDPLNKIWCSTRQ